MEGVENIPVALEDVEGLRAFALHAAVDMTVIGPEAPLALGVVDWFSAAGLRVFGPVRDAARLESSKAFSKAFMRKQRIPTARAYVASDLSSAKRALRRFDDPPVIKASGLASGKGVVLPPDFASAEEALVSMLVGKSFGDAGGTVVIEERLSGPEVSLLAFCDGSVARVMPAAQDHKRLLAGDCGPNTGGMGAFAPSPLMTPELLADVERQVLQPVLDGMMGEGTPYVGVLFVGLMLTPDGFKVLEFNCRMGDPETQAIVPLLESDLCDILEACVEHRLQDIEIRWRPRSAVSVVMASEGYPGVTQGGEVIQGIPDAEAAGCLVFHAATKRMGEWLMTSGGRVLAVTGIADTLSGAANAAYAGVEKITFNGAHYRADIAR